MAQVQIAPAPRIPWPYRVSYPGAFGNRRSRENFRNFLDERRVAQVGAANRVTDVGAAEDGASASDFSDIQDGVPCMSTTTAPRGGGFTFPWWTPYFDGTALPAGTRAPDSAVVAVIDAMLRFSWAVGGDADMIGVWIGGGMDSSSTSSYRANTPGGGSPGASTGGAGFLLDPAGTGFDWVTWGIGGAVANRIAVPAVQTEWNSFRFIVTTALPGGFAGLQASHNGVEIINAPYGTATLPLPYPANTGTVGNPTVPALAFSGQSVTPPSGWAYRFDAKFGRFTPAGQEIQAL